MILPFYPLVKMWFGIGTAIIATLLLAFSDVAIHFSRADSRTSRPLLSLLRASLSFSWPPRQAFPRFHFGGLRVHAQYVLLPGRQNHPFSAIGRVGLDFYCLLSCACRRIPSRPQVMPDIISSPLGTAFAQHSARYHYFGQIFIFGIACTCFISPWLVYYLDNSSPLTNAPTKN